MTLPPQEAAKNLRRHDISVDVVPETGSTSRNIAPTRACLVFRSEGGSYNLEYMYWGLQPSWAKEKVRYATFNCRAEGLAAPKSTWRCVKNRRGIMLMDGYYEWMHEKKEKIPYYITSQNKDDLLCTLCVWDENKPLDMHSCSVVTTRAAPNLAYIHNRMPAIVPYSSALAWIDGKWPETLDLIGPNTSLTSYRVSSDVNKTGVEGDYLNLPLKEPEGSPKRKRTDSLENFFTKKVKQDEDGDGKVKDEHKSKVDAESVDDKNIDNEEAKVKAEA